ncbi:hypothetical protein M3Y99_00330200 [Aphelenchoides fujianensis]|nr:hypothetical protein M3Y99_00330200 [Aphelenchoides fujianensis]
MARRMEEEDELERFKLSFDYYFRQFYMPAFPRDIMLSRLTTSIDTLFRLAKALKETENRQAKKTPSLWETCQSISTMNNHVISPARRRLIRLLNSTPLQNLFLSYDEISNFSGDLPAADSDQYNQQDLPVKIVNIVKGSDPLGATIKAYPNGEIYVARVIAGGAADRCGSIHPGDQIVEVNSIPVSFKHPNEVVQILANNTDGIVSFTLVPGKQFAQSNRTHAAVKRYVRAHFDYVGSEDELQPCNEAALSFQNGDILEVMLGDDPFWQQARIVSHGSLITFDLTAMRLTDPEPSTAEPSIGDEMTENSQRLQVGIIPTELNMQPSPDLWYEPVAVLEPRMIRAIVLIGASGSLTPVDNSAQQNETEWTTTSGRGSEMEQAIGQGRFIEYGEYNGNLYGTMDQSILSLMEQGKTPIVNAHPFSLRLLRSTRFKPIVVFVEPPNFTLFKKTRMAAGARSSFTGRRCYTDHDFAQIISYSAQLSATYGRFTDFRIVNGILEEAMGELIRVLHDYETHPSWVPEQWFEPQPGPSSST